jgi:hypothetical protein
MSKKLLSQALKRAESQAGLARALHVSPSTVRRWKADGLPKARRESVEGFLESERERGRSKRNDRNRFLELMKLAGNIEMLPDIRSHERTRAGRQTSGIDYTKRLSEMLSLAVIDSIEIWARGLKKRFPEWQIVVTVSQYGKGEHSKYKTVYHQVAPDAGDFAIRAEVPTPRCASLGEALDAIRTALEALVGDPSVLTFVHAVTVYNYRMRTDEESSAWETQQRKKREPKKKKAKPAVRSWRSHPIWIPPTTTTPKPPSPSSKSRTPITTRSSASSPSSKVRAVSAKKPSKRASKRKGSASSGRTSKSSTTRRPATRSKVTKKTKSLSKATAKKTRTPSRKTMRIQATKSKRKDTSKKQKVAKKSRKKPR